MNRCKGLCEFSHRGVAILNCIHQLIIQAVNIPSQVVLVEGDNSLYVDFTNELSVLTFLNEISKKNSFIIEEFIRFTGKGASSEAPFVFHYVERSN